MGRHLGAQVALERIPYGGGVQLASVFRELVVRHVEDTLVFLQGDMLACVSHVVVTPSSIRRSRCFPVHHTAIRVFETSCG